MTRNQRLLALAAAAVVAVVIVVVAVVVGGSKPSTAHPATTVAGGSQSFLAGVRQHGYVLGGASAPATLLVFEDPQCPYCQEWSLGALPSVVDTFVRTGRVRLEWRGIAIIGPNSVAGLRAAYAAGQQNRLWNLVEQLYERQGAENSGWITEAVLRSAAKAAGVDAAKMLAAADSKAVTAELEQAARDAEQQKVAGTPTFVLVRPPGLPQQLKVTGLDPSTFDSELAAALG